MASNKNISKYFIFIQKLSAIIVMLMTGCSGHEKSEQQKIKEQNAQGEYIYRHQNDVYYTTPPSHHQERAPYPWE